MTQLTDRQSSRFLMLLDALDAADRKHIITLCQAVDHNQPNLAGKTLIDILYEYESLIDERKNG